MKKSVLILFSGAVAGLTAHAATIKQWDFNSIEFDSPGIGTLRPIDGIGFPAEATGGVSQQFGQVSVVSGSSDPNIIDNSHWRLGSVANAGGFPTATNANKTAGGQFRVNTSGYQNIQLMWDQENSATASRYWRLQYTLNGADWLDATNVITANSIGTPNPDTDTPTWQLGLTADLSAITGANDNPNFGVRFVSEFEATATGAGTNAYVANRPTSTYGVNGTLWFDMVTVMGDDLNPVNQWPTVTAIADQTILNTENTGPLAFDIFDAETLVDNLVLSAHSSNPTLVSSMVFGGSGGQRTLTVTPAANQAGTAVITVRVQDGGNKITESSFRLTVFANPYLSRIFPQVVTSNVVAAANFTVFNLPGDPTTWQFTGTSSDQALVADANIQFSGTDANQTVTITPQPDALGDVTITVTVASGASQASTNFLLRLAPAYIVEWDFSNLGATTTNLTPTTVAEGIDVSDLSRGPGLRAVALGNGFGADRWNNASSSHDPSTPNRANAITRGDYFEFAITVEAGRSLSLSALDVSMRRSALNAALNFEWQYSFDGFNTPGNTILPRGPVWSVLGLTSSSTFQYQGRTSGSPPATLELYDWVVRDVPGRGNATTTPGDPIPTIDLSTVASLQNVNGPATVTFRLYGWGNANTVDSNTSSLGRMDGPRVRGTIGVGAPSLAISLVGSDIRVSWSTNATDFELVSTTSLAPASWGPAGGTLTVEGDQNVVTLPATNTQFFRLEK
ncbi:MAG TPA: hypothetical protein VFZ59_06195 [Verrucomicrobiae bacterium]|nr:hypothetical protein [Verrucomicrobiae bacterium]